MITFLVAMTKYLRWEYLKGVRSILSHAQSITSGMHDGRSRMQQITLHLQLGSRERWILGLSGLSPFELV